MTLTELEQALHDEGLESVWYKDGVKKYVGLAEQITGVNSLGIVRVSDDFFGVFVTDSERGVACHVLRFNSLEQACDGLLKFVRREAYLGWARVAIENKDAFVPSMAEWLMRREIDYSREKAYRTIEYLKQDDYVFCEFLHYTTYSSFVRPELACRYSDWTAERLYKETGLSLQGAFCYMIYLKIKPAEAQANLASGLPNKDVIPADG